MPWFVIAILVCLLLGVGSVMARRVGIAHLDSIQYQFREAADQVDGHDG